VAHLLSVLLEPTVQPRTYLHNVELNSSHRTKNLVAIAFLVQILNISISFTYTSGGIVFTESTNLWSGFHLPKRMVIQRSKKLPGSSGAQMFREVGHSTLSADSSNTVFKIRSVYSASLRHIFLTQCLMFVFYHQNWVGIFILPSHLI
jgi:hypothetical protein